VSDWAHRTYAQWSDAYLAGALGTRGAYAPFRTKAQAAAVDREVEAALKNLKVVRGLGRILVMASLAAAVADVGSACSSGDSDRCADRSTKTVVGVGTSVVAARVAKPGCVGGGRLLGRKNPVAGFIASSGCIVGTAYFAEKGSESVVGELNAMASDMMASIDPSYAGNGTFGITAEGRRVRCPCEVPVMCFWAIHFFQATSLGAF
jgi:hypothetical protein